MQEMLMNICHLSEKGMVVLINANIKETEKMQDGNNCLTQHHEVVKITNLWIEIRRLLIWYIICPMHRN